MKRDRREYFKNKRIELAKRGLCGRCGKRKAREGFKTCQKCRNETARKTKRSKEQNLQERCSRYGIKPNQFYQMLEEQGNECGICGEMFDDKSSAMIDHCHAHGHIRGLLCRQCNTAIGLLKEDVERMQGAIAYIEQDFERILEQ